MPRKSTVAPKLALSCAGAPTPATDHAITGAKRAGQVVAAGVAVSVRDSKLFTVLEDGVTWTEIGAAPQVVVDTEVEALADWPRASTAWTEMS